MFLYNFILNLFLLSFFDIFVVNAGNYQYDILYFEVPIDHFSVANNHSFKIRYLINDTYSKSGKDSPIFFYAGNEGDIELFAENTGFMWEIADEFNATLVFAEHRYYGESLPFGNKSMQSLEHSGYLTSEQTLADFAKLLVDHINPKNRPVVAFGGSYGGMLAAWLRMKYPHLIRGAIASSAPVRQFKTECYKFNTVVSYVFHHKQGNCSANIRRTWDIIKNYSSTDYGRNQLNTKFKFCNKLENPDDGEIFLGYLDGTYGSLAMVNYPYSTSFLAPLPPNPVSEFCARFNGSYDDNKLLDALQNALQIYSNYTGQSECLDIGSAYSSNLDDHVWYFQTCTEMTMPMCSKNVEEYNMFPESEWNFDEFSDGCYSQFKVRPNPNMWATNYGFDFEGASNIVFSNGLIDPWSSGAILTTSNKNIKLIIMPDTAHHLDLRHSHPDDPISVINARNEEKIAIRQWIGHD